MKNQKRYFPIFLLFFVFLTSATCQTVFPAAEWAEIDDEEVASLGWHYDSLANAWQYIRDSTNATGFFMVVGGRKMMGFGDQQDLSYVASVRKSILAILYGKYVHGGKIDLDKSLAKMGMDDHEGLFPHEKEATIRHLISARSGIYHPASNGGDNSAEAPKRGSQKPGEYYLR